MTNRIQRLVAALLLMGSVGACQAAAPGLAGGPVSIRTAAAAQDICEEALATGTLAVNDQSGLGLVTSDGRPQAVVWPFGFTARTALGNVELLDADGKVVAKVGDEITVTGGFGDRFFNACGPIAFAKPGS